MEEIRMAKINQVWFGIEDHGLLSFSLDIQGENWGCGYGPFALDEGYSRTQDEEVYDIVHAENPGALATLRQLLETFHVRTLQELEGQPCYVLMIKSRWGHVIGAIAPSELADDRYDWFNWKNIISIEKEKTKKIWEEKLHVN